jgi:hypothetical protein
VPWFQSALALLSFHVSCIQTNAEDFSWQLVSVGGSDVLPQRRQELTEQVLNLLHGGQSDQTYKQIATQLGCNAEHCRRVCTDLFLAGEINRRKVPQGNGRPLWVYGPKGFSYMGGIGKPPEKGFSYMGDGVPLRFSYTGGVVPWRFSYIRDGVRLLVEPVQLHLQMSAVKPISKRSGTDISSFLLVADDARLMTSQLSVSYPLQLSKLEKA